MNHHQRGPGLVRLDYDHADDLAHLLDQVEDWLRHAGADTHADLAAFLHRPGSHAVTDLIDALGEHHLRLHRLLREQDTR